MPSNYEINAQPNRDAALAIIDQEYFVFYKNESDEYCALYIDHNYKLQELESLEQSCDFDQFQSEAALGCHVLQQVLADNSMKSPSAVKLFSNIYNRSLDFVRWTLENTPTLYENLSRAYRMHSAITLNVLSIYKAYITHLLEDETHHAHIKHRFTDIQRDYQRLYIEMLRTNQAQVGLTKLMIRQFAPMPIPFPILNLPDDSTHLPYFEDLTDLHIDEDLAIQSLNGGEQTICYLRLDATDIQLYYKYKGCIYQSPPIHFDAELGTFNFTVDNENIAVRTTSGHALAYQIIEMIHPTGGVPEEVSGKQQLLANIAKAQIDHNYGIVVSSHIILEHQGLNAKQRFEHWHHLNKINQIARTTQHLLTRHRTLLETTGLYSSEVIANAMTSLLVVQADTAVAQNALRPRPSFFIRPDTRYVPSQDLEMIDLSTQHAHNNHELVIPPDSFNM